MQQTTIDLMGQLCPLPVVLGGFLIGTGITLCPGTCTTAWVTDIPMLSVASLLVLAGMIIGGYVAFQILQRRCRP